MCRDVEIDTSSHDANSSHYNMCVFFTLIILIILLVDIQHTHGSQIINTSYQKLPFGSGDDPDKKTTTTAATLYHQVDSSTCSSSLLSNEKHISSRHHTHTHDDSDAARGTQ